MFLKISFCMTITRIRIKRLNYEFISKFSGFIPPVENCLRLPSIEKVLAATMFVRLLRNRPRQLPSCNLQFIIHPPFDAI
jgi:hypothetical protein